jgi:hypothetical protein
MNGSTGRRDAGRPEGGEFDVRFFPGCFSGLLRHLGPGARAALEAGAVILCLCLGAPGSAASEASAEAARTHLYSATLVAGADDLAKRVAADPEDMEARFGLGMIQFVRAVEKLGQAQYRYGVQQPGDHILLPLLRLPVPPNPYPEAIDYDAFRAMLQDFTDDLATSEATLAGVGERPATVVVDLMKVRLDMTGAGKSDDGTRLIDAFAAISGQGGRWPPAEMKALEVKFESGDAAWLRGYTHVLSALCEFLLAHDFHASFDALAPHFWARPKTPFAAELAAPAGYWLMGFEPRAGTLADLVAAIHLINWPVVAPERMRAVRAHLLAVIADSRLSWKLIDAETDDDREWIPNPRQKHAALGQLVSREQVTAWFSFLDESEAILEGRRLAPHWRFVRGVDVKAFFEKPQTFDLVLCVTGQGVLPYLAEGPITSPERWSQIIRAFEGNFFQFAIWFN